MALRYTADALIVLRESPLCTKPGTLPPAEEWMGPPPETFRNNQGNKPGGERNRNNENPLSDPSNRRPGVDKHVSRNNGNSEDIVLGPPRMTFSSATLSKSNNKSFDNDKALKDGDNRDRFAFRSRNGEADSSDRFRDRERGDRDNRNNFRRRGDADQDSEGWSTVKPRKSFGHEGAERFHGRMGDRNERFGERRPRDPEDRDNGDRPRRPFGEFSKEKEGEDSEKPRRNGLTRNRADQPWLRENDASQPRGHLDRLKSWRDKADDNQGDVYQEKPRERTYDRKWDRDRDHRQERDPEWLDAPVQEQGQAHTQEDFKKFMETMKSGNNPAPAKAEHTPAEAPAPLEKAEFEKTKVQAAPAFEMMGPDKFFAAFGQGSSIETPGSSIEATKENIVPVAKPKTGSRFQKLFSAQEAPRHIEPPTPAASAPPSEVNPLLALAGAGVGVGAQPQNAVAEKVAFQALLQKLQKQTLQATTPPSGGFSEPPPNHVMASPGSYPPYVQDRREEPLIRGPPQSQEAHTPRPHVNPQYAGVRSEQQVLQDLIGQRQLSQSQGPGRSDQPSRNSNSNTEFLMTLMQSARPAPESQRNEQLSMRMPQPSRPAQILPTPDREIDYPHERGVSQHQGGRPTALPSFFDDAPLHHREPESRPQQPTQILQRQIPPPGLDQIHPNAWIQNNAQQMPPPGRPMIPPPGLAGNPRNGPIPGGFPPGNFPMGAFPPEAIAVPPRNMGPPPGFFNAPPPPGFMPPGMPFQGPENVGFGFDHRGMPPPGSFRRN